MTSLSWRDAVLKVLNEASEPMHYKDVAGVIAEQKLRSKMGATPVNTVSVVFCDSLKNEGERSPFVRVSTGVYGLRQRVDSAVLSEPHAAASEAVAEAGLIHAFGMYWSRDKCFGQMVSHACLGDRNPAVNQ